MKICTTVCILIWIVNSSVRAENFDYGITFKGTASGGSLIIADTTNRHQQYISIETTPGESAQSVASRLADMINTMHSTQPMDKPTHVLWRGGYKAKSSGDTLILGGWLSGYALAGTESGLGIPKPPTSLSRSYNENGQIILYWENPPESAYDFILVQCFRRDFGECYRVRLPGDATYFVIDHKLITKNIKDLNVLVMGFKDNIPSNAAAIYSKDNFQSEFFGIPFTDGVAPNWVRWSVDKNLEAEAFEQGEKFPSMKINNVALSLSTKPFYQAIKGSKAGNIHGIYRKFLGLTPGHKYRIIADLTTLDMNSADSNDWSASLCATYNSKSGGGLTARQMAGVSALPNGKKGIQAGEITSFGKGKSHTQGKFKIVGSDANSCITLPDDVNSITVWVRFNCKDPNGKVGFSGVKLEDITGNENIKTLEQIQQQEDGREAELMRMERNYRQRNNLPELQIK